MERTYNPNGLDTNTSNYIKGVTKLLVKQDGDTEVATFEKFDTRNGRKVIYVRLIRNSVVQHFSFPGTAFLFPCNSAVANEMASSVTRAVPTTPVEDTLKAFRRMRKAKKPLNNAAEELTREKKYHGEVDGVLRSRLIMPQNELSHGQDMLAHGDDNFRELLIAAREDKCYLDDHSYISHNLNTEAARRIINSANVAIAQVERVRRKPYFGRVDVGTRFDTLHTAYIGDEDIPGYVVDWRHPEIGNAYYNTRLFQNRDDVVLALKRIIAIRQGVFEGFDDEINIYDAAGALGEPGYQGDADELLNKLLQESRLDKTTHDIIKTIQSDQYSIITADFRKNALVNGCAGSGKTMIMYHRLSYMAYNYESVLREKFNPNSVYIVSPSALFDSCNDELMKKLSIDRITQAPFNDIVEYFTLRYCTRNNIIPFQGVATLIPAGDGERVAKSSDNAYQDFMDAVTRMTTKKHFEHKYKQWLVSVVNHLLRQGEFEELTDEELPDNARQLSEMLWSSKYYQHECFVIDDKKDQKKSDPSPKKKFSPYVVSSISYENVMCALNSYNKNGKVYKEHRKAIERNKDLLLMCLSLKTKLDYQQEPSTNLSDFWKLTKNDTAFRKMLILIAVENLLNCYLAPVESLAGRILQYTYVYNQLYVTTSVKSFYVYVMRALSDSFGKIVREKALVFVDEFQNYSPFELGSLQGVFTHPTFNLYGDFDQRIEEKGIGLQRELDSLFSPNAYSINVNYRNARQITQFINRRCNKNMISVGIDGRVTEKTLQNCEFDICHRTAIICKDPSVVSRLLKGSVNVSQLNIVSITGELTNKKINVLTVEESKGLEFDTVYVFNDQMTENEQYVAYTRALDNLIVLSDDLQELLLMEEQVKADRAKARESSQEDVLIEPLDEPTHTVEEKVVEVAETTDEVTVVGTPVPASDDGVFQYETVSYPSAIASDLPVETNISSEEELTRLAVLERKAEDAIQAQRAQQVKVYQLALQKIETDDIQQMEDAIVLLEALDGFSDAEEAITAAKTRVVYLKQQEANRQRYIAQQLCQHCGGTFKGLFIKHCGSCGRKKDY